MSIYKVFEGTTEEEFKAHHIPREDFLLCHNCGWNVLSEESNAYISHIKCKCNSARGIWFVGDDYVLKERAIIEWGRASHLGPDVSINKLLTEKSTIPVAKEMRYWKDSKSHFFFMKRVPGQTLTSLIESRSLKHEQMIIIAKEVVEYLAQARKFTSTKPETPDGFPVRDKLLGSAEKIEFVTEDFEEWWARVSPRMGDNLETLKPVFQSSYPVKKGPYVLTHGDLDGSNIFIKDGHTCVAGCMEDLPGGRDEGFMAMAKFRTLLLEDFEKEYKDWGIQYVEDENVEEYTNGFYKKCPNFANYMVEDDDGFWAAALRRDGRKRIAEEEEATLAAFKSLSLEARKKLMNKNDS